MADSVTAAIGKQMMDLINHEGRMPVATMGHNTDDGNYQFLILVSVPHKEGPQLIGPASRNVRIVVELSETEE